jgi:hypothetical protein
LKFIIDINNNFLGILGRGTYSSSTSITTISNMAFGFTSNISSEEDCNSKA